MTRVKQQLRKPLCRGSPYVRLALHARAVFSLLPPPLAGPSLQPWASSSGGLSICRAGALGWAFSGVHALAHRQLPAASHASPITEQFTESS